MKSPSLDLRALAAGTLAVVLVVLAIALGSHGFIHFDAALTGYAIGSALAAFAVAYRFIVWASRPPSRLYFKRGFQLLFRRAAPAPAIENPKSKIQNSLLPVGAGTLGAALARNFVAQEFIRRRSPYRWIMHLCLSGGCSLAFAVTFPLVFGWIHFESLPDNAEIYRVVAFGLPIDTFSIHSLKAALAFNALNIAGIFVLIGLALAGYRRLTDPGERATQTFFEDILPLLLIFAVTATGLALTVSYHFLAGRGHHLWAVVHMVSVVVLLLYIPYGKLFHMFQRTCSLCVSRYKKVGDTGPRARCRRCDADYASQMHIDDLKLVLDQLGFDYRFPAAQGEVHYQDICPACRRRLLALSQGQTLGR